MKVRRWIRLSLFVGLVGMTLTGQRQETLKWKVFEKDSKPFYQKVETETTQELKVQDMTFKQRQKQTFLMEWIPKGEKDGDIIVEQKIVGVKMSLDIGGNNGQSILSIKQVLPEARVVTFEPASRHQADLQALAAWLPDVTIRRQALGNADREETLYWPVYNGMAMHALASLDRAEAESWLSTNLAYDPS